MPGDPVKVIAPMSSEEQRVVLAKELGFHKPMPVRYVNWLGDFVTGDMANSYSGPTSKYPVFEKVKEALPVSLELMIMAQFIALVIAIPLAVYSAVSSRRLARHPYLQFVLCAPLDSAVRSGLRVDLLPEGRDGLVYRKLRAT